MDYSQIIDALHHASGFDLYRLRTAIDNMIDDPKRLIEIRARLRLGQQVQWFDTGRNRLCEGTLINIKQTRAIVSSQKEGKRWDIPLCAINIHQVDTQIESQRTVAGLTKNEIQIGERVGFIDGDGIERSGEVQAPTKPHPTQQQAACDIPKAVAVQAPQLKSHWVVE